MRPSIYGTNGTEELREICSRLRAFAGLSRSQKARLDHGEPYIPPPEVVTSKWVGLRAFVVSAAGTLKRVSIFAAILIFVFGTYAGANWVDNTLRTGVHGDYDDYYHIGFGRPMQAGTRYIVKLFDGSGRSLQINYRGSVPTERSLPRQGNSLNDVWGVDSPRHRWVWLILSGASAPTWVDP